MPTPDMVLCGGAIGASDVAESQAANLLARPCQTQRQSARVQTGRTQAAFASEEGCAIGSSGATFQEYRSRGCRRARKLSWRCAWWPLWQLAALPKSLKSFMWTSPFRSSPPTPANTSKSVGRAAEGSSARPAQSAPRSPNRRFRARPAPLDRATVLRRSDGFGQFFPFAVTSPRLFALAPLGVMPACEYGCAHPFTGGTSC